MSRGGRFGGGARGGAGSMGGQMLPFEVDTALESEINAYREKEGQEEADEWTKQLFPVRRFVLFRIRRVVLVCSMKAALNDENEKFRCYGECCLVLELSQALCMQRADAWHNHSI
jgi:hypothetical protein